MVGISSHFKAAKTQFDFFHSFQSSSFRDPNHCDRRLTISFLSYNFTKRQKKKKTDKIVIRSIANKLAYLFLFFFLKFTLVFFKIIFRLFSPIPKSESNFFFLRRKHSQIDVLCAGPTRLKTSRPRRSSVCAVPRDKAIARRAVPYWQSESEDGYAVHPPPPPSEEGKGSRLRLRE